MHRFSATQLFLEKVQRHTRLTDDERAGFFNLAGQSHTVPADTDLVKRGEPVSSTCLVVEGLLARTVDMLSGQRQIAAFYVPGDLPDVHAAMMTSATATLHAVSPTRVARMQRADVDAVLRKFPVLAEALWRETIIDSIIAMEWTANIGRRQAKARLSHLFCEMAVRLGVATSNSFDYRFPVTQENLAEATGMTPVHVNRTLQALRAEQLLDFNGGVVSIRDWSGLVQVAEFDDGYLRHDNPARLLG
jgi:CRP-like cAMP-binding protein